MKNLFFVLCTLAGAYSFAEEKDITLEVTNLDCILGLEVFPGASLTLNDGLRNPGDPERLRYFTYKSNSLRGGSRHTYESEKITYNPDDLKYRVYFRNGLILVFKQTSDALLSYKPEEGRGLTFNKCEIQGRW